MSDSLPTTLIIVCCHAIYLGDNTTNSITSSTTKTTTNDYSESTWLLEPFQAGETSTFIQHIKEGVRQLSLTREKGALAFSGGATKRERLRHLGLEEGRTEAEGYFDLAQSYHLFGYDEDTKDTELSLQHQIFQERYATDSYQNILLSLIQFSIWIRRYRDSVWSAMQSDVGNVSEQQDQDSRLVLPKKLVIISHAFKRARFIDLHLPAIRSLLPDLLQGMFDDMEVEYVGINPPFTPKKIAEIEEGDRKKGYGVWKDDMYGNGVVLRRKRMDRGWDESSFLEYISSSLSDATLDGIAKITKGEKWTGDVCEG